MYSVAHFLLFITFGAFLSFTPNLITITYFNKTAYVLAILKIPNCVKRQLVKIEFVWKN
jgi:hypothetical protein